GVENGIGEVEIFVVEKESGRVINDLALSEGQYFSIEGKTAGESFFARVEKIQQVVPGNKYKARIELLEVPGEFSDVFDFDASLMKINLSQDFRSDFDEYFTGGNFLDTPQFYSESGGLGEMFTDPKKIVFEETEVQSPGKYRVRVKWIASQKNYYITVGFKKLESGGFEDSAFYYLNFNGPIGKTEKGMQRDSYGLGYTQIGSPLDLGKNFSLSQSDEGTGEFGTVIQKISGNNGLNLDPKTRGAVILAAVEPVGAKRSIKFVYTIATPVLLHAKANDLANVNLVGLLYNVFTPAGKEYFDGGSLLLWQPGGSACVDFSGSSNFLYDVRNNGAPPSYMILNDLSGVPKSSHQAGDVYFKSVFYSENQYSISPIGVSKNNSLSRKGIEIKTPFGSADAGESLALSGTPNTKYNSPQGKASDFEQAFELVRQGLMCVQTKSDGKKIETTIKWNEPKIFEFIGTHLENAKKNCNSKPAPVIKAALVQFGNYLGQPGLESLGPFLEKAFFGATKNIVTLDIRTGKTIPFPKEDQEHDYSKIKQKYPWVEPEDIPRLWYYDAGLTQLVSDISSGLPDPDFDSNNFDLIIVATDAQFEGLGYLVYSGLYKNSTGLPIVLVNTFGIGGWKNGAPYPRSSSSEYQIADETIHEAGHFMGLGHACSACNSSGLEAGVLDEKCCQECEWKDDATSYCRQRPIFTSDNFYNKFLSCSLDFVENKFIPAFENGQIPEQIESACG
ncbi:MAG: hypothetical protein AABW85_02240, partial [archaeon]